MSKGRDGLGDGRVWRPWCEDVQAEDENLWRRGGHHRFLPALLGEGLNLSVRGTETSN